MNKMFGICLMLYMFSCTFAINLNVKNDSGYEFFGEINLAYDNKSLDTLKIIDIPFFLNLSNGETNSIRKDIPFIKENNNELKSAFYVLGALKVDRDEYNFFGLECIQDLSRTSESVFITINNNGGSCLIKYSKNYT